MYHIHPLATEAAGPLPLVAPATRLHRVISDFLWDGRFQGVSWCPWPLLLLNEGPAQACQAVMPLAGSRWPPSTPSGLLAEHQPPRPPADDGLKVARDPASEDAELISLLRDGSPSAMCGHVPAACRWLYFTFFAFGTFVTFYDGSFCDGSF